MKRIFLALMLIILSACQNEVKEEKTEFRKKPIALELSKVDYDIFYLDGKSFSLPEYYKKFHDNGFYINENNYFHNTLSKNSQTMANIKGQGYDMGVTFKNSADRQVNTKDATITELYINNNNGLNKDFKIGNITWGQDFSRVKDIFKNFETEIAVTDSEKTLNYHTDKNYVSLFFTNDKLESVAIFSKNYMRDYNFVNGEFVVFGQTVKFPLTLEDLEEELASDFAIDKDYRKLEAGEALTLRVYSPIADELKEKNPKEGIDLYIKNTSDEAMDTKKAPIIKVVAENTSDLSIGNIYVGADINELKIVDKKNQNPKRLEINGKTDKNTLKATFTAENSTKYVYYANDKAITKIEVINTKEIK